MNDLELANQWLGRDLLRYVDMLEILHRGSADVLRAWEDGVMLHDAESGAWFTAADSREALERMLSCLPDATSLFVGHELEHRDYVAQRLGLSDGHICLQASWLEPEPPELPQGAAEPVRLGQEWAEYLYAHYSHPFGGVEYMRGAIERGMLGAFVGDTLAGFVGFHDEGSIGMLEVLPEFRRQGLGETLLISAVRFALNEGKYAFGQVFTDNAASMELQRKIGMRICEEPVYWLF